ncbi:MAG: hypothetical protein KGN84_11615, partial [Acidobacteriota bacterium]|nr:hypothetical protein [Acidobacteriota bacterium]
SSFGPVGASFVQLPSGFITNAGGSYAFHGTAGTDVGAFDASLMLPTPLLSWTNQSAVTTINRTSGLTVTWTGGGAGTYVSISGGSATSQVSASFSCSAPVSAGTFTIPSYVLGILPAGSGSLVLSNNSYSSFTAPGIDVGFALGDVSFNQNVTVQ